MDLLDNHVPLGALYSVIKPVKIFLKYGCFVITKAFHTNNYETQGMSLVSSGQHINLICYVFTQSYWLSYQIYVQLSTCIGINQVCLMFQRKNFSPKM